MGDAEKEKRFSPIYSLQFGLQEPGENADEILNSLAYVRPGIIDGKPFEPLFPLTEKADVNGETEQPIYTYLKVCGQK